MPATCSRCALPLPDAATTCSVCGQAVGHPNRQAADDNLPVLPLNAWQASAGRGPNKILIGLLLALPLGFVGVVGAAIVANWDVFVSNYEAGLRDGLRSPRPLTGDEAAVAIGEVVDLLDASDGDLGSVTVLATSRPQEWAEGPPPPGFRYIAAQVFYEARADWDYSTRDWSARDDLRRRYQSVAGPSAALVDGTLIAGREAKGWLAFLVPEDVTDLWLDFVASDGAVIFTVQIDGAPPEVPVIPAGPALPIT